jgi:hypothetical protein
MAFDFQKIFDTLKSGIVTLAETDLKNYISAATQDGEAVLDALKLLQTNLKRMYLT